MDNTCKETSYLPARPPEIREDSAESRSVAFSARCNAPKVFAEVSARIERQTEISPGRSDSDDIAVQMEIHWRRTSTRSMEGDGFRLGDGNLEADVPDSLVTPCTKLINNVTCRWLRTVFVLPIMGNGMNKVLPGLYVGNYRDSKDNAQLERHGITHIIAIHDAARKLHHDKHYLCVMASDTPDQNLSQYFSICNDFIHAARLRGGNVLIHCLAGMSRSVTVAVAYIMSVTDLSWKEALKVVRVGRSVANPNLGFQKQLQEFETCRLMEERKRLKERYPSLALIESDQEQCRIALLNYQSLLLSKDICEGNCPAGETCPTGLCRSPSNKRLIRRKSSTTSLRAPQSPRMLPPTPKPAGGADLTRSSVSINTYSPTPGRRPCSGPAGLHSYTGTSYSLSRTHSRTDVAELPPGVTMNDLRKTRGNSAPGTPLVTPPASPQHWPRRASTLTKKTSSAQKPSFN